MPLNEADTRAQLIEPKLQAAGWTGSQITREPFYRRDHRYTASRIYLIVVGSLGGAGEAPSLPG
jgi:type I restriction enzyme R subunit